MEDDLVLKFIKIAPHKRLLRIMIVPGYELPPQPTPDTPKAVASSASASGDPRVGSEHPLSRGQSPLLLAAVLVVRAHAQVIEVHFDITHHTEVPVVVLVALGDKVVP